MGRILLTNPLNMLDFNQYNDVVRQRSLLVDSLPEGFFFAENLTNPFERFSGGVSRTKTSFIPGSGVGASFILFKG